MLLPSIFEDNFVDSFFQDMFRFPLPFRSTQSMNTDVIESKDSYQMEIELPGYEKKDIHASLNQGYLTITASRSEESKEEDDKGRILRQERYMGQCKRSFFVGDHVTEEDIKAEFENGVLKLVIPKVDHQAKIPQNRYIPIE